MKQSDIRIKEAVDIVDKKISIFEIAQQTDIKKYAKSKHYSAIDPYPGVCLGQGRTDCIVEEHRYEDQRQVEDIPPAVEKERTEDQPAF